MNEQEQIAAAKAAGLDNVEHAWGAAKRVGLPFWAACALLQKESGGRNVYGHDTNGVFSRDEFPRVDGVNFMKFLVRVMNGATSNGVGPCQITYAGSVKDGHRDGGYFREMAEEGLRPWIVPENMRKGFSIILGHYQRGGTWAKAGTAYNGRESYGADFVVKCNEWRRRLGEKGTVR